MDTFLLDELLRGFLREDLEHGDITTEAIFSDRETGSALLRAREPLVAAGLRQWLPASSVCLTDDSTFPVWHRTERASLPEKRC